jgi:hypothetical protein
VYLNITISFSFFEYALSQHVTGWNFKNTYTFRAENRDSVCDAVTSIKAGPVFKQCLFARKQYLEKYYTAALKKKPLTVILLPDKKVICYRGRFW